MESRSAGARRRAASIAGTSSTRSLPGVVAFGAPDLRTTLPRFEPGGRELRRRRRNAILYSVPSEEVFTADFERGFHAFGRRLAGRMRGSLEADAGARPETLGSGDDSGPRSPLRAVGRLGNFPAETLRQ